MKVRVGYANDYAGATHKYRIHWELGNGKYLAERWEVIYSLDKKPYLASTELEVLHLEDAHEEEVV